MDISNNILEKKKSYKKYLVKKISQNTGAISIEALFTIPMFIFVMILLVFSLRFLAIDDSFNQCLYESTLEYSMMDVTTSDLINSGIFNLILKKNMNEMNLELKCFVSLVSIDDYTKIKSFYTLETFLSKSLTFKEEILIFKNKKVKNEFVYITPSGKKYHYKDCILTKGNGIKTKIENIPDGIDACKNCILGNRYFQKKRE